MEMVRQKKASTKDTREKSLRASRFSGEKSESNEFNSNARFSSIDVNFKRQIDQLK